MDRQEELILLEKRKKMFYNMIDKVSIVSIILSVLYVFVLFATL